MELGAEEQNERPLGCIGGLELHTQLFSFMEAIMTALIAELFWVKANVMASPLTAVGQLK